MVGLGLTNVLTPRLMFVWVTDVPNAWIGAAILVSGAECAWSVQRLELAPAFSAICVVAMVTAFEIVARAVVLGFLEIVEMLMRGAASRDVSMELVMAAQSIDCT